MLFTALLNCTIHLGWFFEPPSLISLSKTSVSHSLSVIAFTLAVYFSERWNRFYNRVVVSADTRTRTLITILLVREISNLLWYHYTISAKYNSRSVTVILKLLLSLHFVQLHADFLYRLRLTPIACRKFSWQGGNRTHDKSVNSRLLYHWATSQEKVGSVASATLPLENKYWGVLPPLAEWSV